MWLIGLIVGAILGASMHGFYGAMWGAVIGWLAGLLLGRSAGSAQPAAQDDKFDKLDKRLGHAQKAVEDIHWRLKRLEEKTGLTAPPIASDVKPATAPSPLPVVEAAASPVLDIAPSVSVAAEVVAPA